MRRFMIDFIFILVLLMLASNASNQRVDQKTLDEFENKIIQKQTIIHDHDIQDNKANQLAIKTGEVVESIVMNTLSYFYDLYDGLMHGN